MKKLAVGWLVILSLVMLPLFAQDAGNSADIPSGSVGDQGEAPAPLVESVSDETPVEGDTGISDGQDPGAPLEAWGDVPEEAVSESAAEKTLAELAEAKQKLGELDAKIAELSRKLEEARETEDTALEINKNLRIEVQETLAQMDRLREQRTDLVVQTGKAVDSWDFDRTAFSESILEGFSGAVPATGKWKYDGSSARQENAREFFAKLRLPLEQTGRRTLYTFTASAQGKGWVGFGLHFFVSGPLKRYSYGEGKSLLVWLTRDLQHRGDTETYLQMYRSDDVVNMERVFDAEIDSDIATPMKVEVLYDPVREYVLIAIDGTVRVVYKTFFGIDEGVSIALRTLGGGCSFGDLSVMAEPGM